MPSQTASSSTTPSPGGLRGLFRRIGSRLRGRQSTLTKARKEEIPAPKKGAVSKSTAAAKPKPKAAVKKPASAKKPAARSTTKSTKKK